MVFFCQRYSFATKHESTVVSCEPGVVQVQAEAQEPSKGSSKGPPKGKPTFKDVPCFEVIFEDTVFFPEGGGQPDDRGVVTALPCAECGSDAPTGSSQSPEGGVPASGVAALLFENVEDASAVVPCGHGASVLRVLRRGPHAVHCLDAPLPVGSKVLQVIDWARRKDHMQQHSAQHLLTAVAEQLYGAETSSWCLGRHTSCVELHTRHLTEAQLGNIEGRANALIAAALPVSVREYAAADLPEEVQSRGLPADHVGDVRVVSIAGLDANACCGTHATCTAQLQAVKILGMEPGRPNKTLVTFVAGDRVIRYLSECHGTLRSLNPLLHTGPEEYVTAVSKLQRSLKAAEKSSKEALKDLAAAEAKLLVQKVQALQKSWQERQRCKENYDAEATSPQRRKVVHLQFDDDDCDEKNVTRVKDEEKGDEEISRTVVADGDQKNSSLSTDQGGVDCVDPLMLVTHHRRLADMDYISAIANAFTIKEAVLLLTAGEDKGPGVMLLTGPQPLVTLLGPRLCEMLGGRGGGKARYTAKVAALHRRRAAADAAVTLLTQRWEA